MLQVSIEGSAMEPTFSEGSHWSQPLYYSQCRFLLACGHHTLKNVYTAVPDRAFVFCAVNGSYRHRGAICPEGSFADRCTLDVLSRAQQRYYMESIYSNH